MFGWDKSNTERRPILTVSNETCLGTKSAPPSMLRFLQIVVPSSRPFKNVLPKIWTSSTIISLTSDFNVIPVASSDSGSADGISFPSSIFSGGVAPAFAELSWTSPFPVISIFWLSVGTATFAVLLTVRVTSVVFSVLITRGGSLSALSEIANSTFSSFWGTTTKSVSCWIVIV